MSLKFKIFSYNIPFILRQEIPLWTLCFAALMLFFGSPYKIALVYIGNILLSISFIFLGTNFRRSKYHANSVNLYTLTIGSFIVTTFLQIIHAVDNHYDTDNPVDNSAQGPCFYAAIGITSLLFLLNIIVLIVFGFTKKQSKHDLHKKSWLKDSNWEIEEELAEGEIELSTMPLKQV
jgi:uncharacterized membrane protein